ncbi:TetR family transcriptional regulator [Actinotalea sp. K2]|uniref:TetR family transcriptional regulator n=1 Tax=Actinotalea sp. K2 TaxID=2939438 RepID=UPI0024B51B8C|nr:TetR family transcriptional regulator [Actinotalea sp. K2]
MASRTEITRARLQACALELFLARGFDATTVTEIADAAGVSHMTFFRHFPTKESVLLDDPYDPLVADAVVAQPSDLPTLERVRRGLLAAWSAAPEPVDTETRARISLIADHPGLRARSWENTQRTEDVIVTALTGEGVPRLEARVAAAACLGAIMAALLDWGSDDAGEPLGARLASALGQLAPPPVDVPPPVDDPPPGDLP